MLKRVGWGASEGRDWGCGQGGWNGQGVCIGCAGKEQDKTKVYKGVLWVYRVWQNIQGVQRYKDVDKVS